jgi:hypothetical protein
VQIATVASSHDASGNGRPLLQPAARRGKRVRKLCELEKERHPALVQMLETA